MAQTIIVAGHGPGISDAVARRFGREGFKVALVARSADRVTKGAEALVAAGVEAQAFPTDLSETRAVRALVEKVRGALGPIGVVHWNAYVGAAGDLVTAKEEELRGLLDLSVHGLLAAVQASLADLQASKGAVLVTGGSLSRYEASIDEMAVSWGAMGLAVAKAAQHKLTGLLNARLAKVGVYAGEVTVDGIVKGSAFDRGNGTLDANEIATKFWGLYKTRSAPYDTITG